MGAAESTEIDVSDKDLAMISLEGSQGLSKIQKFYARRNRITSLPPETALLTQLTEISLRDNAFTTFPKILCQMKNLVKISLSYNQIH